LVNSFEYSSVIHCYTKKQQATLNVSIWNQILGYYMIITGWRKMCFGTFRLSNL